MSSRSGFGRCSRIASSRARVSSSSSPRMIERPCSKGSSSSGGDALLLGPRERQPLDAVRVRVLRRGEAALREQQLAQHVLERLARRPRGSAPRRSRASRAGTPGRAARCRRASSRSAARASGRRPSSGGSRRRPGRTCRRPPSRRASSRPSSRLVAAPEQELERRARSGTSAPGPSRRTPESNVAREASLRRGRGSSSVSGSFDGRSSAERRTASTSCVGRARDVAAPLAPRLRDRVEQLAEARQPVPRLGREVGAAEERLARRA